MNPSEYTYQDHLGNVAEITEMLYHVKKFYEMMERGIENGFDSDECSEN